MSPKEKAKQLRDKASKERCLQIADQMICHYTGINVPELVFFWEKVVTELEF